MTGGGFHVEAARRVFLLSPASTSGKRAKLIYRDAAAFELAARVRTAPGAPLGEVFAFLSGLYFRGKLRYAERFASPREAIFVITSDRGLVSPDRPVTVDDLKRMSAGSIDHAHEPYRAPLHQHATALAASLPADADVILLGSVATPKYVDVLQAVFGTRLKFPAEFVGRGDMSRGGLMLRAVRDDRELEYLEVATAVRRGRRPPRLPPIR